jgi:hypothetical protein
LGPIETAFGTRVWDNVKGSALLGDAMLFPVKISNGMDSPIIKNKIMIKKMYIFNLKMILRLEFNFRFVFIYPLP